MSLPTKICHPQLGPNQFGSDMKLKVTAMQQPTKVKQLTGTEDISIQPRGFLKQKQMARCSTCTAEEGGGAGEERIVLSTALNAPRVPLLQAAEYQTCPPVTQPFKGKRTISPHVWELPVDESPKYKRTSMPKAGLQLGLGLCNASNPS